MAIDTASSLCAASIRVDGRYGAPVRFSERRSIGRGHAEILFDVIHTVFDRAGLTPADVDRIVVNVGPGSFTGLRTGVAAARGLALALACPCTGVTVLEALARTAASERFESAAIVVDAGRGDVVLQIFDVSAGQPGTPPQTLAAADVSAALAGFQGVALGSGLALLPTGERETSGVRFLDLAWPDIEVFADIGAEEEPAAPPRPYYSRAADAKPQRSAKLVTP
ncbi:MAG: tRNA (adenosine(37)-N6)-threonylcarbamoyltransferase complex dimerization subunit type 1 TsaB [Pseudomonadota bacterium]